MHPSGPGVHLSGPGVHLSGPGVHLSGPGVHLSGPGVHLLCSDARILIFFYLKRIYLIVRFLEKGVGFLRG